MHADVLLEAVIGALAAGVAVHDPSGRLIAASPAAGRILDLFVDRIKSVVAGPRWRGENGSPMRLDEVPTLASLCTGRLARDVVLWRDHPDHSERWILARSRAMTRLGNPWYGCVISTFIDMSTRRDVETGLRGASEEAQIFSQNPCRAVDAGPIGAWRFNPASQEFHWNAPMFDMVGVTMRDTVSKQIWHDMIAPEDRPGFRQVLLRALGGENPEPARLRVRRADGSVRHFLMVAAAICNPEHHSASVVGLTLDETDQFQGQSG